MLPIPPAVIARRLTILVDHGRGASEAGHQAWVKAHPTKPCGHCFGKGCFVERDTTRRVFDLSFDASKGDRYEATCPECRGLGRLIITIEEAEAIEAAKVKAMRDAYAELRDKAATECRIPRRKFDALTARRVVGEKTPAAWLAAAKALAGELGIL